MSSERMNILSVNNFVKSMDSYTLSSITLSLVDEDGVFYERSLPLNFDDIIEILGQYFTSDTVPDDQVPSTPERSDDVHAPERLICPGAPLLSRVRSHNYSGQTLTPVRLFDDVNESVAEEDQDRKQSKIDTEDHPEDGQEFNINTQIVSVCADSSHVLPDDTKVARNKPRRARKRYNTKNISRAHPPEKPSGEITKWLCPRISFKGTARAHVCNKSVYKHGVCYYHWQKTYGLSEMRSGRGSRGGSNK